MSADKPASKAYFFDHKKGNVFLSDDNVICYPVMPPDCEIPRFVEIIEKELKADKLIGPNDTIWYQH